MQQRKRTTVRSESQRKRPAWVVYAAVGAMAFMLFLTINYRTFSALNNEERENDQLTTQIQSVTDENIQLVDEIHSLKTDPATVEREAKRLGIPVRSAASVTAVTSQPQAKAANDAAPAAVKAKKDVKTTVSVPTK